MFLLCLYPEANRKRERQQRKHQYSVWQTRLGFPLCVTHSYWFTHKQGFLQRVGTTETQLSFHITLKVLHCFRFKYRPNGFWKGKPLPEDLFHPKPKNCISFFASSFPHSSVLSFHLWTLPACLIPSLTTGDISYKASCDSTSWQNQIQMDLEELKEKLSQVCVFIPWGGFVLWLTPEKCSVLSLLFFLLDHRAAPTHIDLLHVSALNWQMARGNYVYAKCPAT